MKSDPNHTINGSHPKSTNFALLFEVLATKLKEKQTQAFF
jgi:hypothetical protein